MCFHNRSETEYSFHSCSCVCPFSHVQNYSPALVGDVVGSLLARTTTQRLALLGAIDPVDRLRLVHSMLAKQLEAAGVAPRSKGKPSKRGDESEAATGDTPSSPRGEDAEGEDGGEDRSRGYVRALIARLKAKSPPQEVLDAALREAQRLRRTNEQHPGHAASLSYLETLTELPWSQRSRGGGAPVLTAVRAQLDADHFGLDKVKDRVVQYVAVQSLRGWDARAPVLCLVGPPGVGKTSVARSIAAALHRPFQRISLGGVRDEAEIRGHRRTYVGALPGRVAQALRRAGACDAVLLLDEVDKTGRDARGDPAAALLEVLDPEQNAAFVDTYLGVPLDLSKVVFVATANAAADIPPPLLDRLEVVNLRGYALQEKVAIGERHLVPKALDAAGIAPGQLVFPTDALQLIVEGYTREAGVRGLGRCLDALCRHVAVMLVSEAQAAAAVPAAPAGAAGDTSVGSAVDAQHTPVAGSEHSGMARYAAALAAAHWPVRAQGTAESETSARAASLSAVAAIPSGRGGFEPWGPAMPSHIPVGPPSQAAAREATSQGGAGGGGGGAHGSWFSWLPWYRTDPQRSAAAFSASASTQGQSESSEWESSWAASHAQSHSTPAPPVLRLLGPGSMSVPEPATTSEKAPQPVADSQLPLLAAEASLEGSLHGTRQIVVDEALITEVLGPRRFEAHDTAHRVASPGAAAGLVWTAVGGQVQYIECLCVGGGTPGSPGALTLTGQLGDVLEESARIAVSWARAHASSLGLPGGDACPARQWDVHVHLPAGAVPKDGPSAGVTLAVALVSLFTGRCARADTALTGELTLRGLVLPVGGIKEKLIAAHAAGMRAVILPARNMRDAEADVPKEVLDAMELIPVERVEQALAAAFDPPLMLRGEGVDVGSEARL